MCSAPDIPDPIAPVRYAPQKQPTRKDTDDAASRAEIRRKRATSTILTSAGAQDMSSGKTLLGA